MTKRTKKLVLSRLMGDPKVGCPFLGAETVIMFGAPQKWVGFDGGKRMEGRRRGGGGMLLFNLDKT